MNTLPKRFTMPHLYQPTDGSLVLWMKGNGSRVGIGNTAMMIDLSRQRNHGTIVGASWANSPINHPVLSFDAVDDYVQVSLNISNYNTFSMEAWVKTVTPGGGTVIGAGNDVVPSNNAYFIRIPNATGLVQFNVGTAGGTSIVITGSTDLRDNKWHHIVSVKDGNTAAYLYVDGVLVGTDSTISSMLAFLSLTIGALNGDSGVPEILFNGLIDEVRIYNRVLSASEIFQHYNNTEHLYGK